MLRNQYIFMSGVSSLEVMVAGFRASREGRASRGGPRIALRASVVGFSDLLSPSNKVHFERVLGDFTHLNFRP